MVFSLVPKNQQGQLLLEVLISLAILIFVISGVVSAVTVSVRNSALARNKSLANQYAQECLEDVRQVRDNNGWSEVKSPCTRCNKCGNVTPFTRTLNVAGAGDQKTVSVTVSWIEGSKSYNTSLKTILTNWR